MSEQELVEHAQEALRAMGIEDDVLAAGQFYPRGHTGSMFAGGLAGGEAGGLAGSLGEGLGVAGGSMAGMRVHDAASGLPANMLVAVTASEVYGFAVEHRDSPPSALAFRVARDGLEAKVHARVNVRVLELVDPGSGSRIALEGNRLPVTHSKDVIDELAG